MKFFSKIKYPILKVISISGLTFLEPVVRLCYGEEPQEQLKKIGQWIVIPIIAVLLGVFVYNTLSQKVETKSGKLPLFSEIWSSFKNINGLHTQEKLKSEAYELDGEKRSETLAEVETILLGLETDVKQVNESVVLAEKKYEVDLEKILAPEVEKLASMKAMFLEEKKSREAKELAMAAALELGDEPAYNTLLDHMRDSVVLVKENREATGKVQKDLDELRETEFPVYANLKNEQTKFVEKKAFYESYKKILETDNKAQIVQDKASKIETLRAEMLLVAGEDAIKKAKGIVREEVAIEKKKESSYAGAKTIWFQVKRSIMCVFTGFFIGSAIAIPIGILCGLNKTFMAAMTPFIAIFKPVSPIVWLPIVLIVVTGFFPDADKNPVMQFLWDLPLIGEYKINPAFIASALTVALCSLWATMANTALGVASIDKDHMNVARVLKLGFVARLMKIIIPSSLPLIFAGLRISLGVGWMVLIAAELLSSSEGIGKFVIDEFNNGSSESLAKMIVVVFIVGIIGLVLDRIMVIFQRMVSFEGSAATI